MFDDVDKINVNDGAGITPGKYKVIARGADDELILRGSDKEIKEKFSVIDLISFINYKMTGKIEVLA